MTETQTERIRNLNDAFRKSFVGGRVVLTASVMELLPDVKAMAIRKVTTFDAFSPDNDPHGEHDFGAFHLGGHRFFFKLDYYDRRLKWGSEDPSDPEKTTRVLTIMLAEDY